jgi:hypothetical protein
MPKAFGGDGIASPAEGKTTGVLHMGHSILLPATPLRFIVHFGHCVRWIACIVVPIPRRVGRRCGP